MLRLVVNTELSEGKDLVCSILCIFAHSLFSKWEGFLLFSLSFLSLPIFFFPSPILFSSQLHVCQLGISLNEISL